LSEFWLSAIGTPWLVVSTRPDESTLTGPENRWSEFTPSGARLPVFSERLASDRVLPSQARPGLALAPWGGCRPLANPCSAALFGFSGMEATRSCVCAIFLVFVIERRSNLARSTVGVAGS
jgi:hypothetical protein